MKEIWQKAADRTGVSLGDYVKTAVNEKINRDSVNRFVRVTYDDDECEDIQVVGRMAGI